ncbi:MAG TPA: hypothetical protein VI636_06445 [Candidatus Angelobacter sp.]
MKTLRELVIAIVTILAASLLIAQNTEMKLRIMPVNGASRVTDLNFQMGATSGFSVAQVNGGYNLFGPSGVYEDAWDQAGTGNGVISLRFGGDNWCTSGKLTCDPSLAPNTRDAHCGDVAGMFWKSVTSSVTSWLYQNSSTGMPSRLQNFPALGAWPSQAPTPFPAPINGVCQLSPTGIPGWNPVISAAAINAAIPNPSHLPTPGGCTRDTTDPNSFATGAADAKVVYVNGNWYMAFSETINNPTLQQNGSYTWTSADLFLVGWATSNDGKNWTIRHQLFQTSLEQFSCNAVLLVTQLTTDNNYFYMLAYELGGKGLILFRAPIDTANPDGFDSNAWQIETQNGWTEVPTGSVIDTTALQAVSLVPSSGLQGALARVFNSGAPNSPSQIILVTDDSSNTVLNVWSAPDFGQPFVFQSTIDTAFIKPVGLFGQEFGFTYYPDQTPATPRIIGSEFDFWLIGNASGGGFDPTGALRLTAYRTTATLSGGIYSPRAAFRTAGNEYLSVTAGNVYASQTSIGLAARFVILDPNVNVVNNGDAVNLQARNGNYISATNGGGSSAGAVPGDPGTNETFTIVKTNGGGRIVNGDSVAFRSSGGYYLVAENGGGGTVDFPTKTITSSATFTYVAQ